MKEQMKNKNNKQRER